jgi:hypothetical protein
VVHFSCPYCQARLTPEMDKDGPLTRCPQCQSQIEIPRPQGELVLLNSSWLPKELGTLPPAPVRALAAQEPETHLLAEKQYDSPAGRKWLPLDGAQEKVQEPQLANQAEEHQSFPPVYPLQQAETNALARDQKQASEIDFREDTLEPRKRSGLVPIICLCGLVLSLVLIGVALSISEGMLTPWLRQWAIWGGAVNVIALLIILITRRS